MDLSQKLLEEEQTKRRARWEEISGPLFETKWKERIRELKKRTRRERIKAVNEEIAALQAVRDEYKAKQAEARLDAKREMAEAAGVDSIPVGRNAS